MKKVGILLLSFICLISCSDNDDDQKIIPNKTDIIVFENRNDFELNLNKLQTLDIDQAKEWSKTIIKDNSYFDLTSYPDPTLADRSWSLRAILNKDLEFQINDSLFWYNDNVIYYLTDEDMAKSDKDKLKSDVAQLKIFASFKIIETGIDVNIGEKNIELTSDQVTQLKSTLACYTGSKDIKFVAYFACYSDFETLSNHSYSGEIRIKMYELINGKYKEVKDAPIKYNVTNTPWYAYEYIIDYYTSDLAVSESKSFARQYMSDSKIYNGIPIELFNTKSTNTYRTGIRDIQVDIDDTQITITDIGHVHLDEVNFMFSYWVN